MKKQLQIFTAFACLALPNLCASNEIENDVDVEKAEEMNVVNNIDNNASPVI